MYSRNTRSGSIDGDHANNHQNGKLAKQADGSVVVKQGNTMLLATVTAAKEPKDDYDFMPLSVKSREIRFLRTASRAASSGKPDPSDYEILMSRLIGRALRPLFPSISTAKVFGNDREFRFA